MEHRGKTPSDTESLVTFSLALSECQKTYPLHCVTKQGVAVQSIGVMVRGGVSQYGSPGAHLLTDVRKLIQKLSPGSTELL